MNRKLTTTNFTIEFTITPAWFRTIRQLLHTASIQCGFNDRDAGQISMAVDEAMANILKHGYSFEKGGRVNLQVTTIIVPATRINIKLDDETSGIDIDSILSRDLNDIRPGGLGVHLIKTIMDEADWSTNNSGGVRLLLSKTKHNQDELQSASNENPNGRQPSSN